MCGIWADPALFFYGRYAGGVSGEYLSVADAHKNEFLEVTMSRLLFLLAIAAVVYLLIKSYRKSPPQKDQALAEDMVRCAHCGVHLPIGESIRADDQLFCCAAHRDAYRK